MSPAFVVDCSVTMAWCFEDEETPATAELLSRLRTDAILVPALWFLEVSNVLLIAERRQRMTPADSSRFLGLLGRMKVEVDSEAAARSFEHILPLCRSHGLTPYDARYLELSLRRQLPLATLDNDLRSAAVKSGVRLLGL